MDLEKELAFKVGVPSDELTKGEELRGLLGHIMGMSGITHAELAAAGFRPSAEDQRSLAAGTLTDSRADALMGQLDRVLSNPELKRKLKRMKQGGSDEPATEAAARKVPQARGDDWWSLSWSTVGLSPDGEKRWALSVCDATPPPHPHSNKILFTKVFPQSGPPSADECEKALVSAIVYPGPAAGPARQPKYVVFAWRMRRIFPAMQALAARLGFQAVLEEQAVAVQIARSHGTNIEGRNH